jgi:hypothetical protein
VNRLEAFLAKSSSKPDAGIEPSSQPRASRFAAAWNLVTGAGASVRHLLRMSEQAVQHMSSASNESSNSEQRM